MYWRYIFLISLTLLLFSVQAGNVVYGFLTGVVKTDTDAFCVGEKVTVTSGNYRFILSTNETGEFVSMVPAGVAKIEVTDVIKNVKITGGEVIKIEIIIKKAGVILSVNNNAIKNSSYAVNGAYLLNDVKVKVNNAQPLPDGRVFIQMPETAKTLALTVTFHNLTKKVIPNKSIHKIWKFNDKEMIRYLDIDFNKPVRIQVKVFDTDGKAIPDGKKVIGKLSWNQPKHLNFDNWLNVNNADLTRPRSVSEYNDYIWFVENVDNGIISLPECMPGASYLLQMTADENSYCKTVCFNVDNAGNCDVDTYIFTPNTTSLTFLDYYGKAICNEKVYASYIMDSKIKIITAYTNESGMVVWQGLPPVRITVWGDKILAGIISGGDSEITGRLNPPEDIQHKFSVISDIGISGLYINESKRNDYYNRSKLIKKSNEVIDAPLSLYNNLMLFTDEAVPRSKYLGFYLPYDDGMKVYDNPVLEINEFDISPAVSVDVMKSDGITPAKYHTLSVSCDNIPEYIMERYSDKVAKIIRTEKGVDIYTIFPGKYKLFIDMINDPADPAAVFNLPEKEKVKVILNNDIELFPGGVEVKWVNFNNPVKVNSMILPVQKDKIALCYDKNKVLGWWCKTAPDKLSFYSDGVIKHAVAKSYIFKKFDEKGKISRFSDNNDIAHSLFPTNNDSEKYDFSIVNGVNKIEGSENNYILLRNGKPAILWSANYYVRSSYRWMVKSTFNLINANTNEVKAKILEIDFTKEGHYFVIEGKNDLYPHDYKRKNDILIIPDGDYLNKSIVNIESINRYMFKMSVNPVKVTVIYPGYGIARDIPYRLINNTFKLSIKHFKPLATVTGKISDANGVAIKNSIVYLFSANEIDNICHVSIIKKCDSNGNFVFNNIPSGTYQIGIDGSDYDMWLFKVTDNKSITLNLRKADKPYFFRYILHSYSHKDDAVWFLEDGANKAVQLPHSDRYGMVSLNDYKPKEGMILVFNSNNYMNVLNSFINRVEWNKNKPINLLKTNKSILFIISPVADKVCYPSNITVVGTGKWSDIKHNISAKWAFYSGLNCAVSPLGCLPPGEWIIKATTASGKNIEKKVIIGEENKSVRIDMR